MRKIFLIALLISATSAVFGQRYTPFTGFGFEARRLKADSVMLIPSDTTANKTGIVRRGSSLYVGDGSKWTQVQAGAILSDSVIFATRAALYKVADSLGGVIASVTPDSSVFSTKAYRQKGVDSVQANLTAGLALKLNLTDSSLYASRGGLYKVADSLGSVISSVSADSLVFSTKAWRQKGDDSVSALISPRITDSLRALVRLRASGSGGLDLQNSSGTSVANFGSGGSTNISLNGATNVNARLTVTDSIVGVNQRLTGSLSANKLSSGTTATSIYGLTINGDLSSNAAGFVLRTSGTDRLYFGQASIGSPDNYEIWNAQNGYIRIGTNNQQRVIINGNGSAEFSGALTANGKATFTDSIVGTNQRLTGNIQAATFNGSALGSNAYTSTAYLPLSGGTLTGNLVINAGNQALRVNGGSYGNSGGNYHTHGHNVGFTSTGDVWNYLFSDFASFIRYQSGGFQFYTAPSGTAGATMSPSLRYTLDVNGNNTWVGNGSFGGTLAVTEAATFSSSANVQGALTATAQGNNIAYTVDSTTISTSNYTLVAGDASKRFYIKNSSSAITVTIPADASVNYPVGTEIIFFQDGTGDITIAGASGVTVKSGSGLTKLGEQYAFAGVVKLSANMWGFTGNRK